MQMQEIFHVSLQTMSKKFFISYLFTNNKSKSSGAQNNNTAPHTEPDALLFT